MLKAKRAIKLKAKRATKPFSIYFIFDMLFSKKNKNLIFLQKINTVVTPGLLHFAIFVKFWKKIRLRNTKLGNSPDCYTFLTFFL